MRRYAAASLVLGLMLRGQIHTQAAEISDPAGTYLLLGVNVNSNADERMQALLLAINTKLNARNIQHSDLRFADDGVTIRVPDPAKRGEAAGILRDATSAFETTGDGGGVLFARLPQAYRNTVEDQIMRKLTSALHDRADAEGMHDVTIKDEREGRIRVTLARPQDLEPLKRLITARVEFGLRLVDRSNFRRDDRAIIRQAQAGQVPEADELLWDGNPSDTNSNPYLVQRRVLISGDRIESATVGIDRRSSRPAVYFRFDAVGTAELAAVTQANVGKTLAIVLDGKIIASPVIRDPILGGTVEISGRLTAEGAINLARQMKAAGLPAALTIIEEHTAAEDP